jgi:hypothetical protein
MVKNTEELLKFTHEFMSMAMEDLRGQINEFIDLNGISLERLSDAIGVPVTEMRQILGGSNDMKLSTFAKILISTDNIIEIKPIAETQFGTYEELLQVKSQHNNCEMTNEKKNNVSQPRDSRGRFMKKSESSTNAKTNVDMLSEEREDERPKFIRRRDNARNQTQTPPPIDREEVLAVISHFGWDDMVDEENDSDMDLLHFLHSMGVTPQDFALAVEEINREKMQNSNETNEDDGETDELTKVTQMITRVLTSNPSILSQIRTILNS